MVAKVSKADLNAAKESLDKFFSEVNHYGISPDSVNKAVYYNRDITYNVTIGKATFEGYGIPVVAVIDGEFKESPNQFETWYASLFGDTPESANKRMILAQYHLAMLTDKASGWQVAGIAYTLHALRIAKTPFPDKVEVVHKKKVISALKEDFDSMIDGALSAAEGNRKRVETDKGLRRIMHLDSAESKRTPATVLPQTGGKFRWE